MFSKVLLLLIVAGVLCLVIVPTSALMQSRAEEFRLEIFDPTARSNQAQSQDMRLELFDPKTQMNQPLGITVFDPQASASFKNSEAAQGVSPAAFSDMKISQVYTRGGEAGATYSGDFIEIFNSGNTTLDLNGSQIIVNTLEGTTPANVGIVFNQSFPVQPGQHVLFSFNGNGANGQALPIGHFPVTNISLGSTSGQIAFLLPGQSMPSGCAAGNAAVADFVGYGSTTCFEGSPAPVPPSNQSLLRLNNGCTDSNNNLNDLPLGTPNPRTSSATFTQCVGSPSPPPSPTPTATPTPTPSPSPNPNANLRISQVYTRGGEPGAAYNGDFIELYNAGNTTFDIQGYSLVVDTFEGTAETSVGATFPSSFSVPPGMHILLSFLGNGSTGQPLPTGHFPVTNIPLGSTKGTIMLLPPGQGIPSGCPAGTSAVVDFFGYGAATCSEGSPATVPSANLSMTRINGGCTDTNNNANDFPAATPNPRTTASAFTPCGSQPSPTPTGSPTPGGSNQLSFSAAQYEIYAGPVGVTVTVIRSGDLSTAATVNYATSDGTAKAGSDYTATSGTLTFAPGETVQTAKIPLLDDDIIEPDETFNVTLSNPSSNVTLGAVKQTSILIHDNDTPLPTNPKIRISQVYPRGGEPGATFQRDFIELFNADSQTIDLNGWGIVITSFDSNGSPTTIGATIGSTINLVPGQHVILTMPGTGSNGAVLTAEFAIDSISLSSTSGQVFLIAKGKFPAIFICPSGAPDPRGTVADMVAYGAATCNVINPAPVPNSNQALIRAEGGCQDNFNNATDFTLVTPNPRKFAAPPTTPCGAATSSTIQFSAATYNVTEGGGSAQVTVTRAGDLASAASIDYLTTDGTASERSDYNRTAGTLNFAGGEAQKTIDILITDDNRQEPTETVLLALSRVGGNGVLGARNEATLFIQDNDSSAGATNPIDASPFYVEEHYHDFFNRVSDPAGLQFWTNNIESCTFVQECRDVKRIDTSAAFFLSIEFQNTGFLVYKAYKAAFRESATRPRGMVRYREFMRDTQAIGRGVIINTPGAEAILEANKRAFFLSMVRQPEFLGTYPPNQTATEFVDALNANTGGMLTAVQRNDLVNGLLQLRETRATVLRKVAENTAFTAAEFNRAFVLMQYYGYLRRNVDDPPDKDFGGFDFWLGKLNQFNGDFKAAEMVKAFITSPEYRQRFGQ